MEGRQPRRWQGQQCRWQHSEQLMAPLLPTQVLILSPAFLKYIHDNWVQRHGRYPSTGFTALLFALHTCQQVSAAGGTGRCPAPHPPTPPLCAFSGRPGVLAARAQVSVFGFGADSDGNWHHYWEKNRGSGAFRRTRVHDADVEFSIIERLAAEGRILFYE